MKFWMYIFLITYQSYCHAIFPNLMSSRNSTIYTILDNSDSVNLSKFIVTSNTISKNMDETLHVEFKTLKKELFFQSNLEWLLSVHVNQQFFYNYQQNQIIHVLCYLQFSIENSSRFVGSQTICETFLNWPGKNISQSATCEIKIGRSPGFCSTHYDITNLRFNEKLPTWGSINAKLLFESTSLAVSLNSMPVVFNHRKPVNWTVVQKHNYFGKLSLGLPATSVKAGANFLIPVSITETDDISHIRMLVEYDSCLSLNSIEITDKSRWLLKTNFEHLDKKESGVIRLNSQKRNIESNTSVDWPVILTLNFTVTADRGSNRPSSCTIRAGISKVDLSSGGSTRYFSKVNFSRDHKSVPISTDPDKMDLISFKESWDKTVELLPLPDTEYSFPISTYLIQQLGDKYLPQLIKRTICSNRDCPGYEPQKFGNIWLLPVTIEHWHTVLYDLENRWQPESWSIRLSDTELNPISDWRVPRVPGTTTCQTMYQMSRLKVAVRLVSTNSMGLKTYLGATLEQPDPWIDVTSDMVTSFKMTSDVADVVTLFRSHSGSFIVNVNKSGSTVLRLRANIGGEILASKMVSVYTSHWASVVRVRGRCIGAVEVRAREDLHPMGESQYRVIDVIGERRGMCRLMLTVVFNDDSEMALADVDKQWYSLAINGVTVDDGDEVEYGERLAIVLSEAEVCGSRREIFRGMVHLPGDGERASTTTSASTSANTEASTTIAPAIIAPISARLAAMYGLLALAALSLVAVATKCLLCSYHRRRVSKRHRNIESGLDKSPSSPSDQYPSLLPPPGPIFISEKHQSEWAVSSSESGLGVDHSSSLGSQLDPIRAPLSTFRCSQTHNNGSSHNSESSSSTFVRQTSPISDPIIDSVSNSSLLFDHRQSPHGCYWPLITSIHGNQPAAIFPERSTLQERI